MKVRDPRNLIFCSTSNEITTFCVSWPSLFLNFSGIAYLFIFVSITFNRVWLPQGFQHLSFFNTNLETNDPGRVLRITVDVSVPTFSEHSFFFLLSFAILSFLLQWGAILEVSAIMKTPSGQGGRALTAEATD